MTVQVDSREKAKAIGKIIKYFDDNQIQHFVSKLPCGDYMSLDNARLCIDRKQNLQELCGNVSGSKKVVLKDEMGNPLIDENGKKRFKKVSCHARFANELIRANELGIKLIILCEHGSGIKTLEDVRRWVNPRLRTSPKATTGELLYKILHTMSIRHEVEFLFCTKAETGKKIVELLSGCGQSTNGGDANG